MEPQTKLLLIAATFLLVSKCTSSDKSSCCGDLAKTQTDAITTVTVSCQCCHKVTGKENWSNHHLCFFSESYVLRNELTDKKERGEKTDNKALCQPTLPDCCCLIWPEENHSEPVLAADAYLTFIAIIHQVWTFTLWDTQTHLCQLAQHYSFSTNYMHSLKTFSK